VAAGLHDLLHDGHLRGGVRLHQHSGAAQLCRVDPHQRCVRAFPHTRARTRTHAHARTHTQHTHTSGCLPPSGSDAFIFSTTTTTVRRRRRRQSTWRRWT
jgi:hypothetical protein